MTKVTLLLLVSIGMYSTGCPKYLPKNNIALTAIVRNYVNDIENLQAKYDCAAIGQGFLNTTRQARGCGGPPANAADRKNLRNKIIYRLNYFTDMNYNQFIVDLRAGRSTTNVLADITELGAGVAGAITNGERAIHIISVALTAFKGGRKSVDLNYFRERTTDVLINQMEASRAKSATVIQDGLQKDDDEYPLEAALGDLLEYFYDGSLDRALRDLEQTVGSNAHAARNNLLIKRNISISVIPSVAITDNNKAIGKRLKALESDVAAGGALQTAAIAKYKTALTALAGVDKAKKTIDDIIVASGVANINALSQANLIRAMDSIFKEAESDLDLSRAISKALEL